MRNDPQVRRYNHGIRQMLARATSGLGIGFPHSSFLILWRLAALLLGALILPSLVFASNLGDTARQLADRIAAISGPGTVTLDISNRSSLDDKSVHEVRIALEAELGVKGVRAAAADQSMGSVNVVLSESLREYVWTAQIAIGTDAPHVVLVSVPRPPSSISLGPSLPIKLDKTILFSQPQPILDAVVIDAGEGVFRDANSGNARLLILDGDHVAIYHLLSGHGRMPGGPDGPSMGNWELEASLPLPHIRTSPRDLRGRLILRRDHLFDVYLPGVFCRSSAIAPLRLDCNASDDPWPLSREDGGVTIFKTPNVSAFFAPARNFFTGALSPGIGKILNVPTFYSAAALARSDYTLWVLTAVDGSVHLVDGITDQLLQNVDVGSQIASVMSSCVRHSQLLIADAGDPNHNHDHDTLRAIEIPDRDPVVVSPALEFVGSITALWTDASRFDAVAITHREDTGQYEAYRVSAACPD